MASDPPVARPFLLPTLLAAAVLAQGAGLLLLAPRPRATAIAIAAAVGALACAAAWRRGRLPHLDTLLATGAFGGVAMLAGGWLERVLVPPPAAHAMHHPPAHAHAAIWSLSTALMLTVCLPFCVWVCRRACHAGSRPGRLASHAGVCVAMLGGMLLGGRIGSPWLAGALGPAAAAHLAMLGGMVGGTAVALLALGILHPETETACAAKASPAPHALHGPEAA